MSSELAIIIILVGYIAGLLTGVSVNRPRY